MGTASAPTDAAGEHGWGTQVPHPVIMPVTSSPVATVPRGRPGFCNELNVMLLLRESDLQPRASPGVVLGSTSTGRPNMRTARIPPEMP